MRVAYVDTSALGRVLLNEPDRPAVEAAESLLAHAETISPVSVATLDALHLTTAVQLAEVSPLDAILTYDNRLAESAREHGLTVLAPV